MPTYLTRERLVRPLSAMVSIHFSGGCDPGSSPGGGFILSFLLATATYNLGKVLSFLDTNHPNQYVVTHRHRIACKQLYAVAS